MDYLSNFSLSTRSVEEIAQIMRANDIEFFSIYGGDLAIWTKSNRKTEPDIKIDMRPLISDRMLNNLTHKNVCTLRDFVAELFVQVNKYLNEKED